MHTVIDLAAEPTGDRWRSLARALARHAARIQLVLRDGDALRLGATGAALLTRLEPHLVERARRSSWPGTILGAPLLASITHERDAWLELTAAEQAALGDLIPPR